MQEIKLFHLKNSFCCPLCYPLDYTARDDSTTPPPTTTTYATDARHYTAFPPTISYVISKIRHLSTLYGLRLTVRLVVELSIGIFRWMALYLTKYGMNGTLY